MGGADLLKDRGHREFACRVLVYWDETGRMQWKEQEEQCGQCDGHALDFHVRAALAEDTGLPFVPDGQRVWVVYAGGPDAVTAKSTALTVAKALGATLNPILPELGVAR